MRLTKIPVITILFLLLFAVGASAQTKGKKKVGVVKQVYHDVTARNNGYFNADLKLGTVMENVEDAKVDDYTKILSIYTDRDAELAKSYSADLDSVIKKTSAVVDKHAVSKHADNSYFLIGISYFLKGDYPTALETFQYVSTEFKEPPAKKKKKKGGTTGSSQPKSKGKPQSAGQKDSESTDSKTSKSNNKGKPMTAAQKKQAELLEAQEAEKKRQEKEAADEKKRQDDLLKGQTEEVAPELLIPSEKKKEDPLHWLKHQPVRPDAMIWLVDTYTELKKYKEAEAVITYIDADETFPAWLQKDVEIARANMYLKKGDLMKAVAPLTWLTQEIKKKKKKVRYNYILAQIYENLGNNVMAIGYYKQVIKGKPDYEMSFNAKMAIARISVKDNSLPTEEVVKLLKKLLRDNKNSEFYDQVYYALAELSIKANNKEQAIDYLKKSVAASTANTNQKAQSFLRLGELYFEQEKYEVAQPYYDSTLALIQNSHPQFNEISARNGILKNLVTQVNTIALNDSLLKVAFMSPAEKEKLIEKMLAEQEKKKEEKESQQQTMLLPENQSKDVNSGSSSGGWYFDNAGAKASGYNDFIQKWGNRKLEDNWRRKEKGPLEVEETDKVAIEDTVDTKGAPKEQLTEKDKLLKGIPSTDKEIKASRDKIIEAYYLLAIIYNVDLKNYPKAIATFEELLSKYPEDNKYLPETYYNLYLLYSRQNDMVSANKYKDLLMGKYPSSKFANIIKNPDFLKQEKEQDKVVQQYYASTYNYYAEGLFDSVIYRSNFADTLFAANNTLKPKFALLEAFAIGKTQDLKAYKDALTDIIVKYPGDEVKFKAQEILDFINKSTDSTILKENNMLRYEFSAEARHFFLLSIKNDTIKIPMVVNAIAQYNDVNRSLENLKTEPLILPDGNTIIMVKSFENMQKARDYYQAIMSSNALSAFPREALNYYMISDVNLNKVIMNKEIGSYFDYFNVKYAQ